MKPRFHDDPDAADPLGLLIADRRNPQWQLLVPDQQLRRAIVALLNLADERTGKNPSLAPTVERRRFLRQIPVRI